MKINRILSDRQAFEPLLHEHLLNESRGRVVWQLGKIDRAKYSIFKNDAEQEKFLKALASKFRIYLKKERYLTDEQKQQAIDGFITLYRRVTDKLGSLPNVDTRSTFMTDPGDIMQDIFPDFSVSYKTMHQMENVAVDLAIKLGIIPKDHGYETPKIYRDLADKIFKRHGLTPGNRDYDNAEWQLFRSLDNLPYNMRALNDSTACARYVFAFVTELGSFTEDDYKDYLDAAKKYFKIGRA